MCQALWRKPPFLNHAHKSRCTTKGSCKSYIEYVQVQRISCIRENIILKKQKHKGHGTDCTVTKTVSNDSCFNFFAPPEVPESGDLDDAAEAIHAEDFEISHFLPERIIPRSVLYFTGEVIEDDDDDYDEEGKQADEEGEKEGDEENNPDYEPKKDQNPAECKQQSNR
ncbi:hypothetical protein H8959_020811, partial [Pygathrix nigripes]